MRRLLTFATALAVAVMVAACGSAGSTKIGNGNSSSTTASGVKLAGGTATQAWIGGTPNFIFPLAPSTNTDGYNVNLTSDLWPNLVYVGDGGQSAVNPQESLFSSLRYTDGDRTVTIVLKAWKWSDGSPLTSRDVQFTYDLLKHEYNDWINYIPGGFPSDVASLSTPNAHTVVLHLTGPVNPDYYTDDVLSFVPALPQHAWDKTSMTGKVGNLAATPAGAKKVWAFLQKQGGDLAGFDTNPLWKVVDGPFTLSKFVPGNGYYSWVPNKAYSGPDKPILSRYVAAPYTSDTAAVNTLRSGKSLSVASLPLNDVHQIPSLESEGYAIAKQPIPGVAAIIPDLHNAQVGPLLSQLYVRQALEDLIDRPQIVSRVFSGYADPGNGPVPLASGKYVSPLEKAGGPYPYSPSKAIALLKAHGWTVKPNGTSTCAKPGSGAGACGAGVKAGEPLSLQLLYTSGQQTFAQQNAAIQSTEAAAGIKISLKTEPFNTIVSTVGVCTAAKHPASSCGWQLVDFGYDPTLLYPSSDGFFEAGGPNNQGGYDDPKMNRLVAASEHSSSSSALFAYEDYAARQLPWLWLPQQANILVYRSNLGGFTPLNPFSGSLNPEVWYLTKPKG